MTAVRDVPTLTALARASRATRVAADRSADAWLRAGGVLEARLMWMDVGPARCETAPTIVDATAVRVSLVPPSTDRVGIVTLVWRADERATRGREMLPALLWRCASSDTTNVVPSVRRAALSWGSVVSHDDPSPADLERECSMPPLVHD